MARCRAAAVGSYAAAPPPLPSPALPAGASSTSSSLSSSTIIPPLLTPAPPLLLPGAPPALARRLLAAAASRPPAAAAAAAALRLPACPPFCCGSCSTRAPPERACGMGAAASAAATGPSLAAAAMAAAGVSLRCAAASAAATAEGLATVPRYLQRQRGAGGTGKHASRCLTASCPAARQPASRARPPRPPALPPCATPGARRRAVVARRGGQLLQPLAVEGLDALLPGGRALKLAGRPLQACGATGGGAGGRVGRTKTGRHVRSREPRHAGRPAAWEPVAAPTASNRPPHPAACPPGRRS